MIAMGLLGARVMRPMGRLGPFKSIGRIGRIRRIGQKSSAPWGLEQRKMPGRSGSQRPLAGRGALLCGLAGMIAPDGFEGLPRAFGAIPMANLLDRHQAVWSGPARPATDLFANTTLNDHRYLPFYLLFEFLSLSRKEHFLCQKGMDTIA